MTTVADVHLRLATPADAPCISALATQVFLETYGRSGIRPALAREVDATFSLAACRRRLDAPARRTVLGEHAEHAGHLIGFAELALGAMHALVTAATPAAAAAELARLYVQAPFLGRGVGRLLLQRAEALARDAQADVLWLTAWIGNQRALAFYARQGYRILGSAEHVFEGEAVENRLFAKPLAARCAVVLRPYRSADWPFLCRIHDAARLDELRAAGLSAAFLSLERTAAGEGLFDGTLTVADIGGHVEGFVAVADGEVSWLYVHPSRYRHGIGRALLRHAIAAAGGALSTEVLAGNDGALALYLAEGFRLVRRVDGRLTGNEQFAAAGLLLHRPADADVG